MSFPTTDSSNGKIKYAGSCKAVVLDNKDPQMKGRIKVEHPLFGTTVWIPYLQLPFAFDTPEPGDNIYVFCDGGYESHPVGWGKLTANGNAVQLPDVFKRAQPTNRGFYTPGGHLIEYDDGDPATGLGKGIRITTSDKSKIHISEDATDGKITLERKEGAIIEVDGVNDKIKIESNSGDKLSVAASDGIQGDTPAGQGTSLSFNSGVVEIRGSNSKFTMGPDGYALEDQNGNKVTTSSTGIEAETSSGTKVSLTADTVAAENPAGSKMELTPTDVSVLNAAGAGFKASNTQVAIGGPSAELVDLIVQAFQALSTQTAAGFGAPTSTVGQFASLLAQAQTIKGSL